MTKRGEPIPDTVEAWKHHAYLMADLAEQQALEIAYLKRTNNNLKQKLAKYRRTWVNRNDPTAKMVVALTIR
jgi:hypothetical protein